MAEGENILLKYKIVADKTGLTAGLNSATGDLQKFGGVGMGAGMMVAAGMAATVIALKASISEAINWATQVGKLSRLTGMAAEDASKFNFALRYLGMDADKASKAMIYFNSQVMTGGKGFEQYGIATRNAQGEVRPFVEIYADVADRVANATTQQEKLSIATTFFGRRAGADMLPMLTLSKQKMKELADEAEDLGMVLSKDNVEAARTLKREVNYLGLAWDSLKVRLGTTLIPLVSAEMKTIIDDTKNWRSAIYGLIPGIGGAFKAYQSYNNLTKDSTKAIKDNISAEEEAADAENDRQKAIDDLNAAIKRLTTVEDARFDVGQKFKSAQMDYTDATVKYEKTLAELAEMEANGATGTAEYADKKRELARASLDCQNSQMGLFRTTREWIAAGLDAGMSTDALTAQVYALRDSGVLTAGQVAALIGQINAIPPGKSVTISTNVPEAQAQFWSFNQEMEMLFPGGNKWLNLHITETGSGAGRHLQYGGWIRKPEVALIGEAGAEFVLSSAMLQRQTPVPPEVKAAVGGKTGGETTIIINNPTFLTGNRSSLRELARNVKMAMDEDGLR